MLMQLRGAAPWIVGLAAAMVAGAAVAISPLFLAVEVLLLMVLIALLYPGSRWQLAPLTVLVISPAIFLDAAGDPLPNGDAVQKALLIIAFGCLVFTAGVRWSGVGAAAIAAIGLAFVVSILDIGGAIDVGAALASRAFIGYSLPWMFLFVDWRRVGVSRGLGFIVKLPLFSVIAGIPLQIAGVSTVFNVEATGVPRLQGASIPAHLAFLALAGLAAGLCLLGLPRVDQNPRTYLWVGLNLVIPTATVTRARGVARLSTGHRRRIDRRRARWPSRRARSAANRRAAATARRGWRDESQSVLIHCAACTWPRVPHRPSRRAVR
jgi:hypothetical protein